ncbi:3-deoxy-7-phosphoheptulonate synthase [Candidatus Kaiserbacteria bacterium]|nr:3-deoxy-7-phosphoheptulonate synthase [Candidatus Kaiserbacteria bacterium]
MAHVINTRIDVSNLKRLPPPRSVKAVSCSSTELEKQVYGQRKVIESILRGKDSRMLAIVGPCSIHDPRAAIEYAQQLAPLAQEVAPHIFVVMRAYFQKPRTTIGWKGLFYDPDLFMNGGNVEKGAYLVRHVALEIAKLGLPIATEALDQWLPPYIDDLVSWSCIGARTVESQPHRELASGLSAPVGMKNPTDGSTKGAVNGVNSANHPHEFFGLDADGHPAIFPTTGNPYAHVVLRGGGGKPNYERESIASTIAALEKDHLLSSLVIDAAHENSNKDHRKQRSVVDNVVDQRLEGNEKIVGFMVESNLNEGRQDIVPGRGLEALAYGVSITDPCMGFRDTERLLRHTASRLNRTAEAASTAA